MKIFIFHHGLSTASLAKTIAHRVLFWVSMDSKRPKKLDASHFWAIGHPLIASGQLKSIGGIMAPAWQLTSFRSLTGIGLIEPPSLTNFQNFSSLPVRYTVSSNLTKYVTRLCKNFWFFHSLSVIWYFNRVSFYLKW